MEELKNKDKIIKDLDFALKCADAVNRELRNNIAAQEINIRSLAIELKIYKKVIDMLIDAEKNSVSPLSCQICKSEDCLPDSCVTSEEIFNYLIEKARKQNNE